jgi:hypothetical protein
VVLDRTTEGVRVEEDDKLAPGDKVGGLLGEEEGDCVKVVVVDVVMEGERVGEELDRGTEGVRVEEDDELAPGDKVGGLLGEEEGDCVIVVVDDGVMEGGRALGEEETVEPKEAALDPVVLVLRVGVGDTLLVGVSDALAAAVREPVPNLVDVLVDVRVGEHVWDRVPELVLVMLAPDETVAVVETVLLAVKEPVGVGELV